MDLPGIGAYKQIQAQNEAQSAQGLASLLHAGQIQDMMRQQNERVTLRNLSANEQDPTKLATMLMQQGMPEQAARVLQFGNALATTQEAANARQMLSSLLNPGGAGALAAEQAAGGAAGPTNAAAARINAPNNGLLVDPLAARLLMAGDPKAALTELGKAQNNAYQELIKPQNVRPQGTIARYNPATGQVEQVYYSGQVGEGMMRTPTGQAVAIPGYLEGAAAIAGGKTAAQEGERARYDFTTVQTPGSPTGMSRLQALEQSGALPSTQPARVAPQTAPTVAPSPAATTGRAEPGQSQKVFQDMLDAARLDGNQKEVDTVLAGARGRGFNLDMRPLSELRRLTPTVGLPLEGGQQKAKETRLGTELGEQAADKPRATQAARTTLAALDRLYNTATELQNHPGLPDIVGKIDQYPILDMTAQTRGARALQGTLVKQSAVSTLNSMREASKTGGAVGSVTEKEWPILEQQLAALDAAQDPADYKVALENLRHQMKGARERIMAAYQDTYGAPVDYKPVPYAQQIRVSAPKNGTIKDGYVFMGGDPANPASWKKAN